MSKSPLLPFQIKICGLTKPQQAIDARAAGADAIGLNFFEPSIRHVSGDQALAIADAARCETRTQARPPRVVGVFVNHSPGQIIQLLETIGLDGIQLHGDETVDFFVELKMAIAERFKSEPLPFFVRALRTQPNTGSVAHDRDLETQLITTQIQSWSVAGVDTILLDAAATGEFGGTGKTIDWSLMAQLQASSERPLALAGGLTPANVGIAIQTAQVNIVDVASGVESPKGTKCPDLVKQFVQQARTALDT